MGKRGNVAIFVPHAGCPHQCAFCDQHSISGQAGPPSDADVAAILEEALAVLGERARDCEIAFFGGSFTAIPRHHMLRLLRAAQPYRGRFAGIRVSTRPDAVDGDVLRLLREHGVCAVELGAQSMDDAVLAACRRGHTAEEVRRAAAAIHAQGLSLGLQMMTGLPGDTDEGARATARAFAALRPDTVRVYPALVLRGTPLAAALADGRYRPQTLPAAVELGGELLQFFTEAGIRVIRMGLHDSPSLQRDVLAGPCHPAFRELCEGQVLLRRALLLLAGMPPGAVRLVVAKGSASKMAGQRRCNLHTLARLGRPVKIFEQEGVPYLAVRVEREDARGGDCHTVPTGI